MAKLTRTTKLLILLFFIGALIGVLSMVAFNKTIYATSTNDYCMSCHIHTHADKAYKLSSHYNSKSGVKTNCVDCHLPPPGTFKYYKEKASTGMRDLWSFYFKDSIDINWEAKSELENAVHHTFNESCLRCHTNLFPSRMDDEGRKAHFYYEDNAEKLDIQCISCHLNVGHYDPNYSHSKMTGLPQTTVSNREIFHSATEINSFGDYTEHVPGTPVAFNMKAIPGGTFQMGSTGKEPFHKPDEAPVRNVTVSKFFMGEVQVTWDMYLTFQGETMSEGRTRPESVYANNTRPDVDAVSGPTPAFGAPDQGWGYGDRPAITMTHYAAETFCQWLSLKTGKKYRLPTEAEWEYAARGGTETPYFFPGNPKKFSDEGFWRKIFSADTAVINSFAIYEKNSNGRTQFPAVVGPNPFGLKAVYGNVLEYCSDIYAEDAYAQTPLEVTDPKGPAGSSANGQPEGVEYVVRGGFYNSDASDVRSAARFKTDHVAWLKTDPQQPKSIWWYSDFKGIGFRLVCEWEE